MGQIIHFFKLNFWFILGLIISLFLILLWFASLGEEQFQTFFSSDALYMPLIYDDIVVNGNSFQGWTFNGAPNFIPDMLLFFILNGITSNFLTATFLFSIIQYFTIIVLFYFIFRNISNISTASFSVSLYLFAIFLLYFLVNNEFYYSFLLMSNSYHNGMFVMALTSVLLSILFFKRESWIILFFVLIISAISYPCDRLYLFAFPIPMLSCLIVLLISGYSKRKIVKLSLTCIIGVVIGMVIFHKFGDNSIFRITKPHQYLSFDAIMSAGKMFTLQIKSFLSQFTFINLVTSLSIITYVCTIYYCISTFVYIKRKEKEVSLFFIFQLFVLFFTPILMLVPILNGSYLGFDVIRYNYFIFVVLLFNLILLANHYVKKQKFLVIGLNCILAASFSLFLLWNVNNMAFGQCLKNYFSFYPQHSRNLDKHFSTDTVSYYGFTNDFWFSKHAFMFSRKNIKLYSGFDDGAVWLHATNENWFFGCENRKHSNPQFTFLVWHTNKELPDFFKEQNPPYESYTIDDKRTLYFVAPFVFSRESWKPILISHDAQ